MLVRIVRKYKFIISLIHKVWRLKTMSQVQLSLFLNNGATVKSIGFHIDQKQIVRKIPLYNDILVVN
jgi:hypothetical protein